MIYLTVKNAEVFDCVNYAMHPTAKNVEGFFIANCVTLIIVQSAGALRSANPVRILSAKTALNIANHATWRSAFNATKYRSAHAMK